MSETTKRCSVVLREIVAELRQCAKDQGPYITADTPCQVGVAWHRRDYLRWADKLESIDPLAEQASPVAQPDQVCLCGEQPAHHYTRACPVHRHLVAASPVAQEPPRCYRCDRPLRNGVFGPTCDWCLSGIVPQEPPSATGTPSAAVRDAFGRTDAETLDQIQNLLQAAHLSTGANPPVAYGDLVLGVTELIRQRDAQIETLISKHDLERTESNGLFDKLAEAIVRDGLCNANGRWLPLTVPETVGAILPVVEQHVAEQEKGHAIVVGMLKAACDESQKAYLSAEQTITEQAAVIQALRVVIGATGKHPSSCPKGVGIGLYRPPANAKCNCGIDAALQLEAK